MNNIKIKSEDILLEKIKLEENVEVIEPLKNYSNVPIQVKRIYKGQGGAILTIIDIKRY